MNASLVVGHVLMTPKWALIWMLRMTGGVMLWALIFVFCPFEWMGAIHQRLGMGEFQYMPLMSYLTRTLSAMYASMGAILLFLSFDVQRYLQLIRFFGVLALAGVWESRSLMSPSDFPCSGRHRRVLSPWFWACSSSDLFA